jgi:hypothetical protein
MPWLPALWLATLLIKPACSNSFTALRKVGLPKVTNPAFFMLSNTAEHGALAIEV